MKREIFKKYPHLWIGIFYILAATLSMFSIQYLILDWKHFVKTSEYKLFLNILCCLILYLTILFITYRPGISAIISHLLIILYMNSEEMNYLLQICSQLELD